MSKKTLKPPRLVRIEWLDSRIQPGWTDGEYVNPPMFTVGYITKRTRKNIFLAGTWDSEPASGKGFADVACVPLGCVVAIVDLTPTAANPPEVELLCVEPSSPSSSPV